jgi:membrane-bound lytic murein transglycosylase B
MQTLKAVLLAAPWILSQIVSADGLTASRMSERDDIRAFIQTMVAKHDMDQQKLEDLFDATNLRSSIIDALDRPATSRAWYQFSPGFLSAAKVRSGVAFWREQESWLTKAKLKFGVPEEIIVAIIGIESAYGKNLGRFRTMDALTTIAFEYPRRSDYFRQELEQFLLLAQEENVDPLSLYSSYAGAMGWPQFMPSSFRNYAVDFDGDGERNIWKNPADVIGSVAYYFAKFGWQTGAPIVTPAQPGDIDLEPLLAERFELKRSLDEWQQLGITRLDQSINGDNKASLFRLESEPGKYSYWFGLQNFYVISRYNKSVHYSMAVTQLAALIRAEYLNPTPSPQVTQAAPKKLKARR